MIYARQSTAIIVTVGPVLDADGVAVTDGVVGDFKISKNGGAPDALNGSATLTHRNTGHYSLSLTATDVNTVGTVEIVIDDTVNACPVKEIQVVEEAIYDALFAASANAWSGAAGSTTLTALAANSITAGVIATGAIDADAIADNAIDAATFAADVDAEILSYVVDDATRIDASALNAAAVTSIPAILVDTNELQVDWTNGGRLDLLLDAVKAKTDNLPSDPADASDVAGAFATVNATLATISAFLDTEIAAILADTNELQTDWANGGRLDLLIDAIKAKTDNLSFYATNFLRTNTDYVNEVEVGGAGTTGDPWGPA